MILRACLPLWAFAPASALLAAIYAVSVQQPVPRVQSQAAGGGILYLPGPLVGREIDVDPGRSDGPLQIGMFLEGSILGDPIEPLKRAAYGRPRVSYARHRAARARRAGSVCAPSEIEGVGTVWICAPGGRDLRRRF